MFEIRQDKDGNIMQSMRIAYYIIKEKYTFTLCNNYSFSITTMSAREGLMFAVYVQLLDFSKYFHYLLCICSQTNSSHTFETDLLFYRIFLEKFVREFFPISNVTTRYTIHCLKQHTACKLLVYQTSLAV
jgi:hypothetical protein